MGDKLSIRMNSAVFKGLSILSKRTFETFEILVVEMLVHVFLDLVGDFHYLKIKMLDM